MRAAMSRRLVVGELHMMVEVDIGLTVDGQQMDVGVVDLETEDDLGNLTAGKRSL